MKMSRMMMKMMVAVGNVRWRSRRKERNSGKVEYLGNGAKNFNSPGFSFTRPTRKLRAISFFRLPSLVSSRRKGLPHGRPDTLNTSRESYSKYDYHIVYPLPGRLSP